MVSPTIPHQMRISREEETGLIRLPSVPLVHSSKHGNPVCGLSRYYWTAACRSCTACGAGSLNSPIRQQWIADLDQALRKVEQDRSNMVGVAS